MSDDYEVGYKKPPKSGQFKKGRSGNPKGRPKKDDTWEILNRELSIEITVKENGQTLKITKKEALVKTMVNESLKGNAQARRELMQILGKIDFSEQAIAKRQEEKEPKYNKATDGDRQALAHYLKKHHGIDLGDTEITK